MLPLEMHVTQFCEAVNVCSLPFHLTPHLGDRQGDRQTDKQATTHCIFKIILLVGQ